MTEERLNGGCLDERAIRDALAEGPTSGPWVANNNEGYSLWTIWSRMTPSGSGTPGPMIAQVIGDSAEADANAALVAACGPETMRAVMAELDRLRSASRQEGWQLVPVEPTDAMTWAGQQARYPATNSITVIYRAMLAAAPHQSQEAQGDRHGE
jgi:hypothetical protein